MAITATTGSSGGSETRPSTTPAPTITQAENHIQPERDGIDSMAG
jgi:hypothetical protein